MVKLGRYIVMMLLTFLLLACASARMAEEVQSGKAAFDSGDFKRAFVQLLPLAVKCSPEAQYAVGYMYYYGLGVEPHKESGIFWIKQSAEQMYRPAIKAIQMIEKNKYQPEVALNTSQKEIQAQENLVHMAARLTPENKEKEDDVLNSLKEPNKFTLQLLGSYSLEDVQALQSRLKLQNATQIASTKHEGRDWYVLTYGQYSATYLAKLAKDDLPANVAKLHPWVRSTNALHKVG